MKYRGEYAPLFLIKDVDSLLYVINNSLPGCGNFRLFFVKKDVDSLIESITGMKVVHYIPGLEIKGVCIVLKFEDLGFHPPISEEGNIYILDLTHRDLLDTDYYNIPHGLNIHGYLIRIEHLRMLALKRGVVRHEVYNGREEFKDLDVVFDRFNQFLRRIYDR